MKRDKACPCGGADYRTCCRPYHEGAEPPDPASMVRSRFSAFALGDGEYLWRTIDDAHELRARPKDEVVRELRKAREKYRYMRVTIHEVDGARVLFTARIFEKGRDRSFTELSTFTSPPWRYRDGVMRPGEITSIAALEAELAR
jgi:SEC-C motif-containing protein